MPKMPSPSLDAQAPLSTVLAAAPREPDTDRLAPTDESQDPESETLLHPFEVLDSGDSISPPTLSVKALYISHLLSTLNSRIFELGAILFLARLFSGGLLEVSIYAIVRSAAAITFAPYIGTYIDNGNRKTVVWVSICMFSAHYSEWLIT